LGIAHGKMKIKTALCHVLANRPATFAETKNYKLWQAHRQILLQVLRQKPRKGMRQQIPPWQGNYIPIIIYEKFQLENTTLVLPAGNSKISNQSEKMTFFCHPST